MILFRCGTDDPIGIKLGKKDLKATIGRLIESHREVLGYVYKLIREGLCVFKAAPYIKYTDLNARRLHMGYNYSEVKLSTKVKKLSFAPLWIDGAKTIYTAELVVSKSLKEVVTV